MQNKATITMTIALMTAAGLAAPAGAEPQQNNDRNLIHTPGTNAPRTPAPNADVRVYDFHRASSLMGSEVENHQGEPIATVEDLVFERASGQVEQVLLKTGDILGLGGKTVAVPYQRFAFDRVNDRLRIDMTPEQLDRAAKFVPKNWSELDRNAWNTPTEDWLNNLFSDDPERSRDAFADALTSAQREPISGDVLAVRRDWIDGAEQVVLVVDTNDGETRSVILGPSWYVMGQDHVPQPGDSINGDALVFPSDSGERTALIAATFNADRITLRNADGKARWTTSSSPAEPATSRRYVLMSSLMGAVAKVQGKENAGEIQDVVLELGSGQIAILGFDPNTNVLGLADDIKCIPWQAANLTGDDEIRIDASDAAMQRCVSLPDDVTALATPTSLRPVYTPFQLEPVAFHTTSPRRAHSAMGYNDRTGHDRATAPLSEWATDAPFMNTLTAGDPVSITADVTAIRTVHLGEHHAAARALAVTSNGSDQTVILGPERYFAHNPLTIEKGNRVTVEGWKSTIDGHEYIVARTIDTRDGTIALFDRHHTPIWNTD